MYMFTNGQKQKMRAQFAINGQRNSFLRSYRCDGSLASGAPLPQDTLPIVKPVVKNTDPIIIFPNPVQDELTIQANDDITLTGKTAVLYNNLGRPVKRYILKSKKSNLSMVDLSPGVYMLKVGESADQQVIKVIKL
ncbi:MAG: T9SS type A sorting domain-containing protein [Chitinophagaceae bacterium]|nr:MAG: T9SS type A sorting domain-containing protein [Chitinophagaceae bacterium]